MGEVYDFHGKKSGVPPKAPPPQKMVQHPRPVHPQQHYVPKSLREWEKERLTDQRRIAVVVSVACIAVWLAVLYNRITNQPDELFFVWGIGVCGLIACTLLFLIKSCLLVARWRFIAVATPIVFFIVLCREFPAVTWAVIEWVLALGSDLFVFIEQLHS